MNRKFISVISGVAALVMGVTGISPVSFVNDNNSAVISTVSAAQTMRDISSAELAFGLYRYGLSRTQVFCVLSHLRRG